MFVILHRAVGRDAERANLSSQRESRYLQDVLHQRQIKGPGFSRASFVASMG